MAYRVLVFDLDDTLIDTSEYLVPLKLRSALEAMIRAGLQVPSLDSALQQLRESPFAISDGGRAIVEWLMTRDAEKYLKVGLSVYSNTTELDDTTMRIPPIPGTVPLLERLYKKIHLALVTRGLADLQKKKIASASLSPFFRWISVADGNKRSEYNRVLNHFRVQPDEVLVCGDSIKHDLVPARELGMEVVHFRYGWGSQQQDPATYSINRLEELEEILFQP